MRILARGEARERREERRINTDHRNDLTIQLETQACPLSNRGRELEKSIISRRINWFRFHRFRCQKKISQVVRGVILFDTSVDTFWGRTRRGPVVFRHVNRTNEEPVSPTLSHYGQTRKQRGLSFPRCTSPCSITPRDYTNESIDHARPRSINSSQFTKINWLSEWMNEVGETKKFKYSANGKCRSRKEMIKFFRIFARGTETGKSWKSWKSNMRV